MFDQLSKYWIISEYQIIAKYWIISKYQIIFKNWIISKYLISNTIYTTNTYNE